MYKDVYQIRFILEITDQQNQQQQKESSLYMRYTPCVEWGGLFLSPFTHEFRTKQELIQELRWSYPGSELISSSEGSGSLVEKGGVWFPQSYTQSQSKHNLIASCLLS